LKLAADHFPTVFPCSPVEHPQQLGCSQDSRTRIEADSLNPQPKWPRKKKSPSTASLVSKPPVPPDSRPPFTYTPKTDLKNTTDDAIPNYLNSLKFRESHRLLDVRLALGYSAFALAAATFLWDYKLGFESTKYFTAAAVALYTVLNGALTGWVMYVEGGTVYEGTAPSGETVQIKSRADKNVPVYHLTVEVTDPKKKGGKKEVVELQRAFSDWFDGAGRFVAAPFQSKLAGSVAVVGKCDPKRAGQAAAAGEDVSAAYTPEMLDALAKANVSVVGSAADDATGSETKKGGKRRKA
jgi:hypothetical protein